MQLVLTADRHFWKKNSPLLFLGEWCKLYSDRTHWAQLKSETVSYHWDDRARLHQDSLWLTQVYEQVIQTSAIALNRYHGTDHSKTFWRFLLGPWVYYFVSTLFDRYQSIQSAIKTGKASFTVLPTQAMPGTPFADTAQYIDEVLLDSFNLSLYAEIIRYIQVLPYEEIAWPADLPSPKSNPVSSRKTAQLFKKITSLGVRLIPSALTNTVFVSSYLPKKDLFLLQTMLGQVPIPDFFSGQRILAPHALKEREKLKGIFPQEAEERLGGNRRSKSYAGILWKLLPEQLPRVFVEGFESLKDLSEKLYPKAPRTIITANAHVVNETFKFWAGNNQEKGAQVILTQHGGHTGTGKWCLGEHHELSLADHYFSWGWSGDSHVVPLPAGKILKFRAKPRPQGKILFVLNGFPRYSYRPFSIPVAGQVLKYIDDQIQFLEHLEEETRALIAIRAYPSDYGWNELRRIRDRIPNLHMPIKPGTFSNALNKARLFIGTHNTTTYLEALSADFPSVIFWDEKYWELRPEAEPYFEALRKAGILFYDPTEAARKVNEIYSNPLRWWHTPEVQEAKNFFCNRFALSSPHWKKAWQMAIKQIAHEQSPWWALHPRHSL